MIILCLGLLAGICAFMVSLFLYRCVFYKQQVLQERLDAIRQLETPVMIAEPELAEDKRSRIKIKWLSDRITGTFRQTVVCMGIGISAELLILLWAAAAVILPITMYLISSNIPLTIFGVGVGVFGPLAVIAQLRKRGIENFEKQLCSALMLVGNSLRCGFSFQQALKRISQDMPDPIAGEFRQAMAEIEYGGSMENALLGMAKRWNSRELQLLNSAVKLQQKAGGSLVEIIDVVVDIIRKRVKMRGNIRSLSAQGKVSGMIVGGMPVFMVIALSAMDKLYRQTIFYTLAGNIMLLAIGIIEAMGFACIYKIVNIKI